MQLALETENSKQLNSNRPISVSTVVKQLTQIPQFKGSIPDASTIGDKK
jgi:hypothetical protein